MKKPDREEIAARAGEFVIDFASARSLIAARTKPSYMVEDPADTPRPLAEISHGPSAFEAFLDRNQKGMIVLGLVIALTAGAWIVMRGIKASAAIAAGEALSKAESLPDLTEIPKKHAGTPAAGSAAILISSKQWEAGE